MKKRVLMLCLMMALLIPFAQVTQAQDDLTDDEIELVNYLSDAMNKILAMDSIYIEGTQAIDQNIEAEGQTLIQTITQTLSGWVIYEELEAVAMDVTNVQSVESITAPAPPVEIEMTMDMRLVEDALYMRVYDLSPEEVSPYFPADWINFAEDGADYEGFQLLNPEQLTNVSATTGMTNIFTENVVRSIVELDGETLEDGTETRVFEVEVDAVALMEDDTIESTLSAFNFESLGVDMTTLIEDMLADAVYTTTIWVDPSTDLPVQVDVLMSIDTELTMMGTAVQLVQEVASSFTYSRFNEEVEIVAPDLSDS